MGFSAYDNEQDELRRRKKAEIDIWEGRIRLRAREYLSQGISLEEAEEKATTDIRREIRGSQ